MFSDGLFFYRQRRNNLHMLQGCVIQIRNNLDSVQFNRSCVFLCINTEQQGERKSVQNRSKLVMVRKKFSRFETQTQVTHQPRQKYFGYDWVKTRCQTKVERLRAKLLKGHVYGKSTSSGMFMRL